MKFVNFILNVCCPIGILGLVLCGAIIKAQEYTTYVVMICQLLALVMMSAAIFQHLFMRLKENEDFKIIVPKTT